MGLARAARHPESGARTRTQPSSCPTPSPQTPSNPGCVKSGLGAEHRLVIVHVGARIAFRRWPPECFAETIDAIARADARTRFVVIAGPGEDTAERVVADARGRMPESMRSAVLDPRTWTLDEMHALSARAALYIGCDTGPAHIAGTTAVPIVALYGPTLPETWAPWRPAGPVTIPLAVQGLPCRPCDQRVCEPGDFRCLNWIQPEQVLEAAIKCLHPCSHSNAVALDAPQPLRSDRFEHAGYSRAHRHRRRSAVLDRGGADSADDRARPVGGAAPGAPRTRRGAIVLLAPGPVRRPHARVRGVFDRAAHEPGGLQTTPAVSDRAADLPARNRIARYHAGHGRHFGRRHQRRVRHHPVPASFITIPSISGLGGPSGTT